MSGRQEVTEPIVVNMADILSFGRQSIHVFNWYITVLLLCSQYLC